MSCEQSIINCCPVGRFALTTLDDCKKVQCSVPVCNNLCGRSSKYVPSCCECGCKSNSKKVACCVKPCSESCNCVPPCWDYGCKDDCKKVACNNPCSNPCNYIQPCLEYDCKPVACKDFKDGKGVPPCGSKAIGRFQVIDSGDSTFCKPVCERNTLMSCNDQGVKTVAINNGSCDCKSVQPCGNKMTGRFPVVPNSKLDPVGPCCEPTHALAIDNMM